VYCVSRWTYLKARRLLDIPENVAGLHDSLILLGVNGITIAKRPSTAAVTMPHIRPRQQSYRYDIMRAVRAIAMANSYGLIVRGYK